MHITTKYNVGDLIWVPRCYQAVDKEELQFEGEVWYKDVIKYKSLAKQKRVVKIEASVNEIGNVLVMYYLINEGEGEGQMSNVYAEDLIHDYTEEQALQIAKEYEQREESYYGI
jgi:hypothetical protein